MLFSHSLSSINSCVLMKETYTCIHIQQSHSSQAIATINTIRIRTRESFSKPDRNMIFCCCCCCFGSCFRQFFFFLFLFGLKFVVIAVTTAAVATVIIVVVNCNLESDLHANFPIHLYKKKLSLGVNAHVFGM